MARERMVTRTVEITTAEVMCMDVVKAEVITKTYDISGTFTDDELLKAIKKLYETDTFKVVHVVSQKTSELLYGMSEAKFIEMAQILPPRQINK